MKMLTIVENGASEKSHSNLNRSDEVYTYLVIQVEIRNSCVTS